MKIKIKQKLVYGFGINDADYTVHTNIHGKRKMCPFYRKWNNMIERAYSHKLHEKHPTYKDVTICDEWKSFMAFRSWMVLQDWENKELDKDILFPNNKIYSPLTCCFVTSSLNKLLIDSGKTRGVYKIGVYFDNGNNKFRSRIRIHGINKHLGYFLTEEEAYQAYKTEKIKYIKSFFQEVTGETQEGLMKHIKCMAT